MACFRAMLLTTTVLLSEYTYGVEPLPDAPAREVTTSRTEWKLFIPVDYQPRESETVDLLVHFHGSPPVVVNNAAHARLNAVVVTVNYNGLSSVYRVPFSDPKLFQTLLDDTFDALRAEEGFADAQWGSIALSSFSAGYGAVREILKQSEYREQICGILAADSLYASTDAQDGTPVDAQMADYKTWAELAARGDKVFVFTHTQVATPTYESTAETGDELLEHLGLAAEPTEETGLGPLTFTRKARRGNFILWGSQGDTGEDHMNHLRYMAQWLGELPLAQKKELGE